MKRQGSAPLLRLFSCLGERDVHDERDERDERDVRISSVRRRSPAAGAADDPRQI